MFRLRIDKLREVAAEHGDRSGYAIAQSTGIAESSVYRFLNGSAQPDLISMLRIHDAYGAPVETLMERVAQPAEAIA
jgi:DNA-binding phage protein